MWIGTGCGSALGVDRHWVWIGTELSRPAGPVCWNLPETALTRYQLAGPRLVSRPARPSGLRRTGPVLRHQRLQRAPGGLVGRGVDHQPGAGRGLDGETGRGHSQPRVKRMPEQLGVRRGLGHVLAGPHGGELRAGRLQPPDEAGPGRLSPKMVRAGAAARPRLFPCYPAVSLRADRVLVRERDQLIAGLLA